MTPIPAALREALEADDATNKYSLPLSSMSDRLAGRIRADRARAMAAVLRWVATLPACDVFEPYPNQCQNCIARNAALAALEQEATP